MIDFNEQENLLKAIGKILKRKTEVYLIGGSAMLYYEAKTATKDIDIVTTTKSSFEDLRKAITSIGFYEKTPFIHKKYDELEVEKKINKPVFFILNDKRIDLFLTNIVCYQLSEYMIKRATQSHEYDSLIIKIISPEDIIILKCATEREGDRIDAKSLIENYNINWYTIISEASHQTKIGQDMFVIFLYDFLQELKEDMNVNIPIKVIREIRKIGEKALINIAKKGRK
ncbi:MAG: nucleotidyltransferase [Candidatus Woesearchaeota archaeon]